jgi:succinate-semialdehyde dehydrogenase / glutarate-semialdehyde dehydrogenase
MIIFYSVLTSLKKLITSKNIEENIHIMNLTITNPRTGLKDYQFALLTEPQIKEHCETLRMQQKEWHQSPIEKRIETLQIWKSVTQQFKQDLIDALIKDTGRVWETKLEVDLVASSIDRWCGIAKDFFRSPESKKSSIPFISLTQQIVPFALVGVISPWNFPLLLSLIDTIPALLAGCGVVVKPSEVTPRFIEVIKKIIDEVQLQDRNFPLHYLQGDGSTGVTLINHCDIICFTGSTVTGKKVYEAASKKMIPVFLELGGKDPAIVLDGANLDEASSAILWGSTANAGQSCLSIERVYVQENSYEKFLSLIVFKAKQLQLNATNINEGKIGPIIFEKQVHIINEQLKDALEKGAVIEYGNAQCENINGGHYCLPTILSNVNHTMKIMQEETFGPIIPIMKFKTKEAAIALANDTIYGLSGAIFAATVEEATALAQYINGGAISINDAALTAIMHEGEKNSFKMSGIGGTRMGPNAIKRFMRQKVLITKTEHINSPWWYS